MDAAEFASVKSQRAVVRTQATKDAKEVRQFKDPVDAKNSQWANRMIGRLKMHFTELKEQDAVILANTADKDLESESQKGYEYRCAITDAIADLESKIKQFEAAEAAKNAPVPQVQVVQSAGAGTSIGSTETEFKFERVPYMELTKFDGNPLNYEPFWDDFKCSVDERKDLNPITKFKLLRRCLVDAASNICTGYKLTKENYEQVKSILEERYGDKETAVALHLEALVKMKPAASQAVAELRRVRDQCEAHIRALVILGFKEDTFGQLFAPILLSKLPKYVRLDIRKQKKQCGEANWSMDKLREALSTEIELRSTNDHEFFTSDGEGFKEDSRFRGRTHDRKLGGTALGLHVADKPKGSGKGKQIRSKLGCAYCGKSHYSSQCATYPDVASRQERLGPSACFLCLYKGHRAAECRKPKTQCFFCRKAGHHSSLCLAHFGKSGNKSNASTAHVNAESATLNPNAPEFAPDSVIAVNAVPADQRLQPRRGVAILASATVTVVGEKRTSSARIVFDDGSTRSYISKKLADNIGARRMGFELTAVGRFGETERKTKQLEACEFDIILQDGTKRKVEMNTERNIAPNLTLYPLDVDTIKKFCPVDKLAEVIVDKPTEVEIDILLGLDYYYAFVGSAEYRCPNGLVIKETKFGYIVTGFKQTDNPIFQNSHQMLVIGDRRRDPFDLEKFWKLEEMGIADKPGLGDDEIALQHFNSTVKLVDNRYWVQWPFKTENPPLPSNYNLALRRLNSVLRKLKREPEWIFEYYTETFKKQEAAGMIEKAPEKPEGVVHHLCHHAVVKPERATTKVRVVFDASAKIHPSSLSLNESMFRGPVFLNDLCGLLIRFRLSKVVVISDVEKAFLQIYLQRHHRDCTRFLWIHDLKKPVVPANICVYRYARVPFGVTASPFLLAATIMHHFGKMNSPTAKDIVKNLYVDNVFSFQSSNEGAMQYYRESKKLFDEISMPLREWYSNDRQFMADIAKSDRGSLATPSVLGLKWELDSDSVSVTIGNVQKFTPVSKRIILRSIASVYDPCGWFGPVIVRGKLMMQRLWKEKKGWDDPVAEDVLSDWIRLADDLQDLPSLPVQRYIGLDIGATEVQLHCFCDASAKAFGAAIYIRASSPRETKCNLVFAKSRVAPLNRELTIPKMELVACTVGSNLIEFVSNESSLPFSRKILWSDSTCALSWIHKKELSTVFVSNRVKGIRAIPDLEFRYVPTEYNPADLLSRGLDAQGLNKSTQWWNGPAWLVKEESHWPANDIRIKAGKDHAETQASKSSEEVNEDLCALTTEVSQEEALVDLTRFSSVRKLYGVTCRVMRALCVWVPKFMKKHFPQFDQTARSLRLTAKELTAARSFWDRRTQLQTFPDPATAKLRRAWVNMQRQLGIYRDKMGILRSSGRFKNAAELKHDAKFPILLPTKSKYTRLVIKHMHEESIHSGPQATLAALRCQYWVPRARSVVKRVLNDCRLCRRFSGGHFQIPDAPPLPEFRCSIRKPFAAVGLDYIGPLQVRNGQQQQKVWIALYTCTVMRAIHLDLVGDLSTNEFLRCLRRFIATYGQPELIVSDNAKQFKMADKILKKLWMDVLKSDEIQTFSTEKGIEWKFITERAPWMGGMYERMVRPVKDALKKSIGPRILTKEELQTLLLEVAAIVNERPLLYQGTDPDEEVLTPAHLMFRSKSLFPEVQDYEEYKEGFTQADELIKHWKQGQKVLRQFWDNWRNHYLLSLRERPVSHNQRNTSSFEPAVGTTVLIKDNIPRGMWRFGRIESLNVSKADNKVRSAKVRLANGHVLSRPLRLLYPLELAASHKPEVASSGKPERQRLETTTRTRPTRRAAVVSERRTRQQLQG